MRKSLWLLLIVIAILVFCITYFFPSGTPQTTGPFPPGPNVRISSTPFQPTVANESHPESQPDAKRSPLPESGPEPTDVESPLETQRSENAQSDLRVRVMDALGEPVKKGVITLAGAEHTFYGGLFLSENVPTESCEMIASADGYSSATETFDPSKKDEYSITLEYTSSHKVTVYSDKKQKKSCPGVDVYLWKGAIPPRPLKTNSSILVEGMNDFLLDTAAISRDNTGLRVSFVRKSIPDAFNKYLKGVSLRPDVDDLITGVDLCDWGTHRWKANRDVLNNNRITYTPISDPVSTNLRVWDVLSMAEKMDSTSQERVMIRFLHNDEECYSHFRLPSIPSERVLIERKITDNNGQCVFSDLPTGLYYVQARKDRQRSPIATFLPTRGHTKLSLSDSSRVIVKVVKSGLEQTVSIFGRSVPHAKVSLTPNGSPDHQGKGIYSGITDAIGTVVLKPVQWGTYQMIVQIPEEHSAPPIIQDVTIENPYHYFTVQIDTGVSVSGKVVRKDNDTGVTDYPVELIKIYSNDNYTHGVVRTDKEGKFVFTKVQSGAYILQSHLDYDEKTEFVPYPTHFFLGAIGALPNLPNLEIDVHDTDIEGLEYPVMPVVLTRLKGHVVDEDNTPVPGARLSIEARWGKNPLSIKVLGPQPPITDNEGKFNLTIPWGADPEQREYTFYLVADLVQVIPYTPKKNFSGFTSMEDTIVPLGQGEIPFSFHIGEEKTNLTITINTNLYTKRIAGIIKMEDGGSLEGISISARQDQFQFPASLSDDGTFLIHGVKPGKIVLSTYSRWVEVQLERLGTKVIPEYQNEFIQMDIPADENPDLFVEITLKKAGYLAGTVLDNQGIPKKGVWILTQLPWNKGFVSENPTGADGQFFIFGIPLDYTYNLTALDDKSNTTLTVVEGVSSNSSDVVIRCP